jgi:hypothetical protein
VFDLLTRLGVKCWMDINGGMSSDIYDSMAEGVSSSSAVVCFMCQKYQESSNCMLEAKFAKQQGIEMVPVLMEGGGWRASGWLGLLTAGSLWVPLYEDASFAENVRQLHGQIVKVVGAGLAEELEELSEDAVASPSEAKEELARLREDLDSKAEAVTPGAGKPGLADPSQPAIIPAGVPKLPAKFQSTDPIRELIRLVLSTEASDVAMPRVGWWGMGGIGAF